MLKIDEVAYHNRLSQVNPYMKCALSIGLLLLAICTESYYVLVAIVLVTHILLLGVAGISFKFYLKLLCIPMGFLVFSMMMILFTFTKDSTDLLGYIKCFGVYIGYTAETIRTASFLFVRCLASISCMYFMSLTVGMNQLIRVMKRAYIPHEIIELIILMYRFIFIFLEEVEEIRLAQEMRFGYRNLRLSYHSTGVLIKTLFTRMEQRYKELCVVLEIKLYNGKFY